jgi:arsenate reductase (thioredoxin)
MTNASERRFNVLFLCTGNSARSIFAEALMNDPAIGGGRFRAYSAGSHPSGVVNPLALELLRQEHISIAGLRSKSWDEFERPDAPHMDFVFTVCDQAAAEQCPLWPGRPATAHWSVPDPAAVRGSNEEKTKAFRDAFLVLKRRIETFASLPFDTLNAPALQERIKQIGRQ